MSNEISYNFSGISNQMNIACNKLDISDTINIPSNNQIANMPSNTQIISMSDNNKIFTMPGNNHISKMPNNTEIIKYIATLK